MANLAEPRGAAELVEMLTYARPHRSATEAVFVTRFIDPLGVNYDKYGNAYKRIGKAPILWSCHTDTVHHKEGWQEIGIENGHIAYVVNGKHGDCLGADDGAGVWLMCEMIRAKIPGLYVFHAGEEHGCLGSKYIAEHRADFLDGIKAAIAFDRKGTRDIITHQMGARSCSDAFALSLASAIGMQYRPDDSGTYTDTVSYTNLIGECTNVSVGYEGAHGHTETLDLRHLINLRNKLVKFDASGLIFEREPGDEYEEEWFYAPANAASSTRTYRGADALVDMVYEHPEVAAKLIEMLGGNADDMMQALIDEGIEDYLGST